MVVGGVDDHVHILFTLARTRDVASVIKEAKRGSSVWAKAQNQTLADFAWQSAMAPSPSAPRKSLGSGTASPPSRSITAERRFKTSSARCSNVTTLLSTNDSFGTDATPSGLRGDESPRTRGRSRCDQPRAE
ncbi:transposase [Lacipirellula limnantheis]|uniref:transposase n=1 Tax=Lacipirellula limnantheis TaxID=2528024 RepID=UPI0011A8877E